MIFLFSKMKARTTFYLFFLFFFLSAHIPGIVSSCQPLKDNSVSSIVFNKHSAVLSENQQEEIPVCTADWGYEEDEFSSIKKKISYLCLSTTLNTSGCDYADLIHAQLFSGCTCTFPASRKYILHRVIRI